MNTMDNECLGCGASLKYNPNTNSWICEFCRKEYTIEMLKTNIDKYNNIGVNELDEYECSNCGAKVVSDKSTSSTTCIYCNSSVIIKKRLIGDFKPDYIVPFSNKKEDIAGKFIEHLKGKFLCGKKFANKKNIKSITSLYVPFWLVSCDVMGRVKGNLFGDDYNRGTYNRLGVMKLVDVPADAKSNLDNNLLKSIMPIDYSKMVNFEYPYLAGSYAEKFDLDKEDVYKEQIKEEIREIVIKELTGTVRGYNNGVGGNIENVDIHINKLNYKYVLVPIWFIKMEYKGKEYEYCINDSTNKIAGTYYVDKGIRNILILLAVLVGALILPLIQDELMFMMFVYIFSMVIVIYSIINSYSLKTNKKNQSIYIKPGTFKILESNNVDFF